MISFVIVWLNGPFGVGKSTVAIGLKASLANATIVDPEQLGYPLRAWQPPEVARQGGELSRNPPKRGRAPRRTRSCLISLLGRGR